ncbi:MAG: 4-hydroxy-tetrahydrodipicolinate reductase [Lachnospiraceae bacterium]|nr:4-hydroxy-tetrahydrodipicolinate reductase [Lachnospiraceae bacterium]
MVRVILHGCNGKMGQTLSSLIAADDEIETVAGIDAYDEGKNSYPVFTEIGKCDVEADAIIDFSTASAVDALLDYCMDKKLPCVLCTTGLSDKQLDKVKEASGKTAVLKSANMSLGINMLLKILKDATSILSPAGFDVEIVEKHHNQKLDAPSGTALALADSIKEELDEDCRYIYDRSGKREKRSRNEIGISAVRGGTIVGDHDVIFAGTDEVITFSHRAYSKAVFGKGAIQAAKFLKGKPAGLYDMSNVIRNTEWSI